MSFLVNPYWYASGCDPDAVAFLTAAGITDPTITSAICTLVTSMKANGTWAKCSAIYPFVGNTASQQKWNLKDPRNLDAAFRLSFSGGWVHSANGALPNGSNAYADTFIVPNTVLSINSNHTSFYSRTNQAGGAVVDIGCSINSNEMPIIYLALKSGTTPNAIWYSGDYNTSAAIFANSNSLGFFNGTRTANNSNKYFKNGTVQVTNTSIVSQASLPTVSIVLGAYRYFLGIAGYSQKQCAFASIGSGLSDAEAGTLYTDVQAFNTTLGRNV